MYDFHSRKQRKSLGLMLNQIKQDCMRDVDKTNSFELSLWVLGDSFSEKEIISENCERIDTSAQRFTETLTDFRRWLDSQDSMSTNLVRKVPSGKLSPASNVINAEFVANYCGVRSKLFNLFEHND